MLFRPEPKQKNVLADLYRVTSPDDPVLENGNKLCKGKAVAYLIVWKSEKIGKEAPTLSQTWEVIVLLDDGKFRVVTMDRQPDLREGDKVRIDRGQVVKRGQ